MRSVLSIALAIGMLAVFTNTSEAQVGNSYSSGYGYGAGFFANNSFGGGCCTTPRERPPYFAQFPPVYYSGIVRRPYGVSPFAAPAGIAPVELSIPVPVTIANPFYDVEVAPVSNEQPVVPAIEKNGNKVTWQYNPYIESMVAQ